MESALASRNEETAEAGSQAQAFCFDGGTKVGLMSIALPPSRSADCWGWFGTLLGPLAGAPPSVAAAAAAGEPGRNEKKSDEVKVDQRVHVTDESTTVDIT
ncbi:hypothetical protein ACJRO7_020625 [Eucalyptus globulus]|uniref:Uncharacterized protein n=1 Tax=Eucalyptus globulus TaxID=34317 RepID=A0ABD3KND8_EUCGL